MPILFTLTDDNYEEREVSIGTHINENCTPDQFCTQFPKTYRFLYNDKIIRLIDTPDIGVARGIEKDKEHFYNILSQIANYDKLHGICILLKPNSAWIEFMFKYCIKKFLANLHKDTCRNIVFCFTNSRVTSFKPGDTFASLKKMLESFECNDTEIKLSRETIYCVDNEWVRFLAACETGIEFKRNQQTYFSQSWETSVAEINRFIEHIASVEPHLVKGTLTVNHVRHSILKFRKPIADITAAIQKNIFAIDEEKSKIKNRK